MLQRVANVRNPLVRLLVFAVVISGGLIIAPQASANNTNIDVTVCGTTGGGAELVIREPTSDAVVDESEVTLRGTVKNATQIDVFVDDAYSQTYAIPRSQQTFDIDVSISRGTHTIKLVANDICGGQDAEESVVVTYEPASEPSRGGNVPTEVIGGNAGSPNPPNPPNTPAEEKRPTFLQDPVITPITNFIDDAIDASGIPATVADTPLPIATLRVTAVAGGLAMVVFAGIIAPQAATIFSGALVPVKFRTPRMKVYQGWIIRLVGVSLLASALLI